MSVQSIVSGADITFTYGPEKGVRYLSEGVPRRLAPGSRAPGRHVTAAMAPRGVPGPGRVFGTKFKRRRAGRRLECLETGRSPRAVTSPPAGRLLIYCSRRRRHAGPAPGPAGSWARAGARVGPGPRQRRRRRTCRGRRCRSEAATRAGRQPPRPTGFCWAREIPHLSESGLEDGQTTGERT